MADYRAHVVYQRLHKGIKKKTEFLYPWKFFRITQLKQLLEVIPEQSLKSHCFKEQQMQPSPIFAKIFQNMFTLDHKNIYYL